MSEYIKRPMCFVRNILFVCAVGAGMPALATTHINANAEANWLGAGINSQTGKLYSKCVTGTEITHRNTSLNLHFENKESVEQSIRDVAGTGSVSVNLGLFGGGASLSVHTRMESNSNTVSVAMRFGYRGKGVSLENRGYTALGEQQIGNSKSDIMDVCGDEFINYIQYGNDIYLVSQLVFNSKEEYEKFVAKVTVKVLFFKTTATYTDEFFKYAKEGSYSIKAISSNPLPSYIRDQLGGSDELNCSVENENSMAACVNAGNNVLSYLTSGDSNSYKTWLADESNLGIIYFFSGIYEKYGHSEYAEVVAPNIDDWLALDRQLKQLLKVQRRNRNVFNSYAEVPIAGQLDAVNTVSTIDTNIARLEGAQATCDAEYGGGKDISVCQAAIDDAKSRLVVVDL